MCGIAGYFGFDVLNNSNIEKCLTLMKQRGPDFNSSVRHRIKNGKFAYFLHSRLAIIDLDKRSNQPYKGDNTILSFNAINEYFESDIVKESSVWTFQHSDPSLIL